MCPVAGRRAGTEQSKSSDGRRLEVDVAARKNSKALCSDCGKPGSTYDHLGQRVFHFPPLWGIAVVFVYAIRQVIRSRP